MQPNDRAQNTFDTAPKRIFAIAFQQYEKAKALQERYQEMPSAIAAANTWKVANKPVSRKLRGLAIGVMIGGVYVASMVGALFTVGAVAVAGTASVILTSGIAAAALGMIGQALAKNRIDRKLETRKNARAAARDLEHRAVSELASELEARGEALDVNALNSQLPEIVDYLSHLASGIAVRGQMKEVKSETDLLYFARSFEAEVLGERTRQNVAEADYGQVRQPRTPSLTEPGIGRDSLS